MRASPSIENIAVVVENRIRDTQTIQENSIAHMTRTEMDSTKPAPLCINAGAGCCNFPVTLSCCCFILLRSDSVFRLRVLKRYDGHIRICSYENTNVLLGSAERTFRRCGIDRGLPLSSDHAMLHSSPVSPTHRLIASQRLDRIHHAVPKQSRAHRLRATRSGTMPLFLHPQRGVAPLPTVSVLVLPRRGRAWIHTARGARRIHAAASTTTRHHMGGRTGIHIPQSNMDGVDQRVDDRPCYCRPGGRSRDFEICEEGHEAEKGRERRRKEDVERREGGRRLTLFHTFLSSFSQSPRSLPSHFRSLLSGRPFSLRFCDSKHSRRIGDTGVSE
jgi:hypothetical protein